jgi:hypothetical protein
MTTKGSINKLILIAEKAFEKAKTMTKKEAINSLNEAGIVTKKGKFKKAYAELEQLFKHNDLTN